MPRIMDELLQIPGVARKTANVLLGTWYKNRRWLGSRHPCATHRTPARVDPQRRPQKIEPDLMKVIPRSKWIDFSHQIIHHGRALCIARNPQCADYPLESLCRAADKTWSTVEIHQSARS